MPLRFVTTAGCARADIVADKISDLQPGVLSSNRLKCSILTEMTRERMVMEILEDLESEVSVVWHIDSVVQPE